MDISAIAVQGLDFAQAQLGNAAAGLASAAASGGPVDLVALSQEAVALTSAKTDFSANVAVLQTANQVDKQAINLMA
jgi:flagellar hook protein FlgE